MERNPLEVLNLYELSRQSREDDDNVSKGSWDHESLAQVNISLCELWSKITVSNLWFSY